jgi:hypothetical protein
MAAARTKNPWNLRPTQYRPFPDEVVTPEPQDSAETAQVAALQNQAPSPQALAQGAGLPGLPMGNMADPRSQDGGFIQLDKPFTVKPGQAGSTLSEDEKREANRTKQILQQLQFSPEEMADQYKVAMDSPAVQGQQAGLDNMQKLIQMEAQAQPKVQTDLTPLMQLTDAWSGSNFTKGYQRPDDGSAGREKLRAYYAKMQDDSRDLSKTVLEAMKARKMGTVQDNMQEKLLRDLAEKLQDPTMGKRAAGRHGDSNKDVKWVFQKFSTDPLVTGAKKGMLYANQAESALAADNWVGDRSLPGMIAGAAGERPLSNQDIYRYSSDPSIAGRLSQLYSTLLEGRIDPQHREDYKQLVTIARQKNDDILNEQAYHYSYDVGAGLGVDPNRLLGMTQDRSGSKAHPPGYKLGAPKSSTGNDAGAAAKTPNPAPSGGKLSPEKQARLDALLAKKAAAAKAGH